MFQGVSAIIQLARSAGEDSPAVWTGAKARLSRWDTPHARLTGLISGECLRLALVTSEAICDSLPQWYLSETFRYPTATVFQFAFWDTCEEHIRLSK